MRTRQLASQSINKGNRGFSLVEMLVSIAAIGIIAGIAIVGVSNMSENTRIAVAQRRAQDTAQLFAAGLSTGAPSFMAATNVRQAQNAVGAGANGSGAMSNVNFRIVGLSDTQDDALPVAERSGYYLSWEGGILVYDKAGGHFN